MKKLTSILSVVLALFAFSAKADFTGGISLVTGKYETDGTETEKEVTGVTSQVTSNSQSETFVGASLFVEYFMDNGFALGVDYVPMSMESETSENVQTSSDSSGAGTNTVQVDFEDLTTIYATLAMTDNLYLKVGYVEVDVITNESLATGGSYGNTSLDGHVVGIGYHRDLDTGAFVRLEANFMDLDGATLTNTADSTKSVTADGADGYGAKLSIGKSF